MKERDGEGRWYPLLHFDLIYYISTYKREKVMIWGGYATGMTYVSGYFLGYISPYL